MKVLIVDGPARGQVRFVKGPRFEVIHNSLLNPSFQTVTYHVHSFRMLSRTIRLASTYSDPDAISDPDVFEYVASDLAKEAAI